MKDQVIRDAKKLALQLGREYDNKVVLTLQGGELHCRLLPGQPMTPEIERTCDTIVQEQENGPTLILKNRDNPLPEPGQPGDRHAGDTGRGWDREIA